MEISPLQVPSGVYGMPEPRQALLNPRAASPTNSGTTRPGSVPGHINQTKENSRMNVLSKSRHFVRTMAIGCATAIAAASLAVASPARAADAPKDIVDTAVAAGSFNTLATALKAAGLVDALKAPGPFTVFAPTDAAFAKLPAGTLDDLLKPANKDKLKGILLYHVVSGKITAADIKGQAKPKTLQGATLDVKAGAGGVTVNGVAKVTGADVAASNGVIHVIDAVLLPPG
jgi:uncharacterized surface protein with fasciclin (FAS1) repeats